MVKKQNVVIIVLYIFIYILYYIITMLLVTKSHCGFVFNQVESAQYLG